NADAGHCFATVSGATRGTPTTTGCGNIMLNDTHPISDQYSVGTNSIVYTASDALGNTATCTQTITVLDNQSPTVTCPANLVRSTDANHCSAVVSYTSPTVGDNCPNPTATCSPASGSTFVKGITTVTCTATDASSNTATCTFTVTVTDTQNP